MLSAQQHFTHQTDDDDDPYETNSTFTLGMNYLSNNVYLGRKDSVRIPYFSPYISFKAQNGLYAKAQISYTDVPKKHIDLLTLEGGYQHSFGDLNTGIAFDKFFYSKKSTSVKANITGSINLYGMYSNDYVEPLITTEMNFGATTDYVLGLAIDHTFFLAEDKLSIIPTVTTFSGTQHYYDQYQIARNPNSKKVKKPKAVIAADKFQTLDYELSLPISYTIKHWVFSLTPVYVLPQNPSQITVYKLNGTENTVPEKISDSFFLELDIAYRIMTGKANRVNKPRMHSGY